MQLALKQADPWVPSVGDVADAVVAGLRENYRSVRVSVGACPDLRRLRCAFPASVERRFSLRSVANQDIDPHRQPTVTHIYSTTQ